MDKDTLQKYIEGALSPQERAELLSPPATDDSSEVLMSCPPADYSASAIARAVEDCNAQLLALSVTALRDGRGWPVIALRLNVADPDGVERSLRRYGYNPFFSASASADTVSRRRAQEHAREVLHYLDL